MTKEEVLQTFQEMDVLRVKNKVTGFLFDAMLIHPEEGILLVREVTPYPADINYMTLDYFCEKYDEYCGWPR